MEWAFKGPYTLARPARRPARRATRSPRWIPDDFVAICCDKPAIHRFPGSMGKRIWERARFLADHYDGDAANASGKASGRRRALPPPPRAARATATRRRRSSWRSSASGSASARRAGRRWQRRSATTQPRSVADVADAESLAAGPGVEEGDEGRQEVEARTEPGPDDPDRDPPSPSGSCRLAGWGAAALAVALVRNRLWATPNLAFFTLIADNLGRNPFRRTGSTATTS